MSMSADGRFVLVANYGSGSLSVLPVEPDGSLGVAACTIQHVVPPDRDASNVHCVVLDAANRFVLATDLGLDRIFVYAFDAGTGQLSAHDPPHAATSDGAGPRHVAFHPDGRRAYCITEYDNTLIAMDYDPDAGAVSLSDAQPTLPPDFSDTNYGADVWIHPNGRFVYVSNRGHDSIAIFEIEKSSGGIQFLGREPTQGEFPRGIAIDPSGRYLLVGNENTDSVVTFRIDDESGGLQSVATPVNVAKPVCFTFVP
jgi:6-phosphogluconolactonase